MNDSPDQLIEEFAPTKAHGFNTRSTQGEIQFNQGSKFMTGMVRAIRESPSRSRAIFKDAIYEFAGHDEIITRAPRESTHSQR